MADKQSCWQNGRGLRLRTGSRSELATVSLAQLLAERLTGSPQPEGRGQDIKPLQWLELKIS